VTAAEHHVVHNPGPERGAKLVLVVSIVMLWISRVRVVNRQGKERGCSTIVQRLFNGCSALRTTGEELETQPPRVRGASYSRGQKINNDSNLSIRIINGCLSQASYLPAQAFEFINSSNKCTDAGK
jgi:hypothetical protein